MSTPPPTSQSLFPRVLYSFFPLFILLLPLSLLFPSFFLPYSPTLNSNRIPFILSSTTTTTFDHLQLHLYFSFPSIHSFPSYFSIPAYPFTYTHAPDSLLLTLLSLSLSLSPSLLSSLLALTCTHPPPYSLPLPPCLLIAASQESIPSAIQSVSLLVSAQSEHPSSPPFSPFHSSTLPPFHLSLRPPPSFSYSTLPHSAIPAMVMD